MISEIETFEKFGYFSYDFKPKSAKKVIAVCEGCELKREVYKFAYTPLCLSCSIKKLHKEGILGTEKIRKKMSKTLTGRRYSLNLTKEQIEKRKQNNLREKNPNWKNGIMHGSDGYILIINPYSNKTNDYIRRARFIMQEHLGRKLTSEEVVHHVNEIKTDDRIENLILFKNDKEHTMYHKRKEQ